MLYCEKCKSLFELGSCSFCGHKKTREVKENDAVYLTTKNYPFSGMLEAVLTENNIPYWISRNAGIETTVFRALCAGEHKFFVPFGEYEKAKELLEYFFEE